MKTNDEQDLPPNNRILIIDGDSCSRDELIRLLASEGFAVSAANDGPSGLRTLYATHPHAVIMAATLPDMDGWTALQRIREVTDIPILLLCDDASSGYRAHTFNQGVQDCISRPIDVEETVLRLKVALRRGPGYGEQNLFYDDGVLRVDAWKQDVSVNCKPVALTRHEMALLCRLLRAPGSIVTYDELLETLPWLAGDASEEALRALVYRLRRRLEDAGAGRYIVTHRALGFRLDAQQRRSLPEQRQAPAYLPPVVRDTRPFAVSAHRQRGKTETPV